MCAARISYQDPTGMYLIPSGAKINADLYIDTVLKPVLTRNIPRLYGKQKGKVVFHHDNAPAHRANKTQGYIRKSRVKFVSEEYWLGNSLDWAPMYFAVNGISKDLLFKKKPRAIKTEWLKLLMEEIRNALKSRKGRVKLMLERNGH